MCAWRDVSLGYPSIRWRTEPSACCQLARGEWELAYPRLLSAYSAFPESGFLCSRLAEASLRTNRLEQTEQLLAATLEGHDTFESLLRLRAGLLAERGKDTEARALFERTHSSGYVVLVGGPRIARVSGVLPGPLTTGVPGPLATLQIAIPNSTALCGRRFYTQAVHFGGGLPFALSNPQDFVIGRQVA